MAERSAVTTPDPSGVPVDPNRPEPEPRPDDAPTRGLRRYVEAVASGLGLSGPCWRTDPGPPATAYVAVEPGLPSFADRDFLLLWDEEYGWAAAVRPRSGEPPVVLTYRGGDVLAPVPDVVGYVAALRRGDHPGDPRPIRLRAYGAADDLVERLRGYAR
ncbi:MAG: hypothetical protein HOV94_05500 [Saccharothrix sp.]|nr:hypothetical protein [Saccharothrix sp.]